MTNTQQVVLALLRKHGPMSDHGIIHAAKAHQLYTSPSGLRTRRAELTQMGLVHDSGERELTPVGRKAVLWTVA